MNLKNLYWPVYLNLEQELISLSNCVSFEDEQLDVYSIKIAELLLRCSTEIESISKELYYINGGNKKDENGKELETFFDTDCLEYLEKEWSICQKQVLVTSTNFYFEKEENRILTPLLKANKRGKCDWKKAYQAIKHNRAKELKQANIKHLIRSMASLFLLNVYFKDEKIIIENIFKEYKEHISFESKVFAVKTYRFTSFGTEISEYYGSHFTDSVYIQKYTDSALESIIKEDVAKNKEFYEKQLELWKTIDELKNFFVERNKISKNNTIAIIKAIGKPLLQKMEKLSTFEEKKEFIIKNPEYQKNEKFIQGHIKQIYPEKEFNLDNGITHYNLEEVCLLVANYECDAKIRPQLDELNKNYHHHIDTSNKRKEIVLNKNQKLYKVEHPYSLYINTN